MGSLKACLLKHPIGDFQKNRLRALAEEYAARGEADAEIQAAEELLNELMEERADIVAQIENAGGEAPPSEEPAQPLELEREQDGVEPAAPAPAAESFALQTQQRTQEVEDDEARRSVEAKQTGLFGAGELVRAADERRASEARNAPALELGGGLFASAPKQDAAAEPAAAPVAVGATDSAITSADVDAAKKHVAERLAAVIDGMKAPEVQKRAAKVFKDMGGKVPVGKAKIREALLNSGATYTAIADDFGIEMAQSMRDALEAEREGRVGAEQAVNDRDTFTVDRLNTDTDKVEPVSFKRGEYVRFTLSGKDHFGEIDGISRARGEFSVDGLWYPFGFAYKAERPAEAAPAGVPLSEAVEAVNAKHGVGLNAADAVPGSGVAFTAVDETIDAVRQGKATVEQFREAFKVATDRKDAVLADLGKKTKDDLLRIAGGRPDMKKDQLVERVYDAMLEQFALGKSYGPNSYVMSAGGLAKFKADKMDALKALVEGQTTESLAEYAAGLAKALEEEAGRRTARAEALKNPKTLDEFRAFMRQQVDDGKSIREARLMLTTEQREQFDTLLAEQSRSRRTQRKDEQREIRTAGQKVDAQIIATKHTKKGHDLYVVRLGERVPREDYETLNTAAKRMGGYYSSFRGSGAVPGFQFTERETAEAFVKLANGDAAAANEAAQARRDAFEDDRSQTAVERLNEMADRLDERADESLAVERKANTDRRARMAASAEASAHADKAMAKTMRNIATAISDGRAKFLDRVRQKVQVEMLEGAIRSAKSDELRARYPNSYGEQEKRRGEPATGDTVEYAEFPTFTMFRSDLATLGRQLEDVEGLKQIGAKLTKVADDVTAEYTKFAKENLIRVAPFAFKDGGRAEFANREAAEKAIKRSGLRGKAIVLPLGRGKNAIVMSPSEAQARGIWQGDGDKRISLDPDVASEIVEKLKGRRDVQAPWQFVTANDRRKALARMGIETPAEYRSALREFIGLREKAQEADRVKELERSMVGRANDGLDFFPTPASVADEMIDAAELKPDMAVLEPSAGMGHIADRIRAAGAEPDVIEASGRRRELLEAKGYHHVYDVTDFMNMEPRKFFTYGDVFEAPDGTRGTMRGVGHMGSQRVRLEDEAGNRLGLYDRSELKGIEHRGSWSGYDRIIMNPPFSNGQDMKHVRHAYDLLRPGGRIVAIMGEGAFFRDNQQARDFREWLDSVGGTSEKLAEGTFLDPTLPVNTGVNARMVVIDKPAAEASFETRLTESLPGYARFGAEKAVYAAALRQAKGLLRIDSDVELRAGTGMSRSVPMRYDADAKVIEINPWFDLTQAAAVEVMVEELAHSVDALSNSRAISAGSARLDPGGDIRTEIEAAYVSGGAMGRFWAYPLLERLPPSRMKAELFARLPMLYFGHPQRMMEAMPNAYRAVENIFGPVPKHHRLSAEIRASGRSVEVGGKLDAGRPSGERLRGGDGEGRAGRRLGSVRQAIARELNASILGTRVQGKTPFQLQTTPPDGGVSVSGGPTRTGIGRSKVQAIVDGLTAKWTNAPRIVVLDSMDDPRAPADARAENARQLASGAQGAPRAFIAGDGTVYMVGSELPNRRAVLGALFHEALGHYGLRRLYGAELEKVLRQIIFARRSDVRAKAKAYGWMGEDGKVSDRNMLRAAEEVLAELAETKPNIGFVRRAIAAIRTFLRKLGIDIELSNDEIIRDYILPARRFVERGSAGRVVAGMDVTDFQRVWHGTPHKVDRFSLDKIGTGEGANAFGWGVYFAGKREVAEFYRATLSERAGSGSGTTYQAEIPDEHDLLDWDKPLEKQSPEVQTALLQIQKELPEAFHEDVLERRNADFMELTGAELYHELKVWASEGELPGIDDFGGDLPRQASMYLGSHGIVGLQYKAGRFSGKQDGGTNYVIWDESVIGEPEAVAFQRGDGVRKTGYPPGAAEVASVYTDTAKMKAHPSYAKAKAGDHESAVQLVLDIGPELLGKVSGFGSGVIYVAPHANEASGRNAIPHALAEFLAARTGASADESIVQTSRAFRTGADAMQRMISRPTFGGEVKTGASYVLVDDVSTVGGTLAELAEHILSNGGRVVGSAVIVNASRLGTMHARKAVAREIERRFGNEVRQEFGVDPEALTAEEAQYLIGFRTADELRNRATAARQARAERLRSKGIQLEQVGSTSDEKTPPDGGVSRSGTGTAFQRGPVDPNRTEGMRQPLPLQMQDVGIAEETLIQRLQRKWQDKFNRVSQAQKAISEAGRTIGDPLDVYAKEQQFYGKTKFRLTWLEKTYVDPLVRNMVDAGVNLEQLDKFLYAKHAPEANAHIASINPQMPDGGSGMTTQDAIDYMNRLDPAERSKLERLAVRVHKMNKGKLFILEKFGLVDPQQIALWKDKYQFYVPLKSDIDPNARGTGMGYDVRGPETKRRMGRQSLASSPTLNSIRDYQRTVIRAGKAEVGQSFLKLAQAFPDVKNADGKPLWEVKEPAEFQTRRIVEQTFTNPITGQKTTTRAVEWGYDPTFKLADNVFSMKEGGKQRFIQVNDDVLASQLKNLGDEKLPELLRLTALVTRALSALHTGLNPEFWVTNLVRDIQAALTHIQEIKDRGIAAKGITRAVAKDVFRPSGLIRAIYRQDLGKGAARSAKIAEWQTWMEDFEKNGGRVGFYGLDDLQSLAKDLDSKLRKASGSENKARVAFAAALDRIEAINAAFENMLRLSTYRRLVESGVSKQQAAVVAKNLTVNFNKKGELSNAIGALYMFFNASVQGTMRVGQALMNSKSVRVIAATYMLSGVLTAMWNSLAGGDDDDKDEQRQRQYSDWTKNTNVLILAPDGEVAAKIPIAYGYNLPYVLGYRITEAALDPLAGAGTVLANMAGSTIGVFDPTGLGEAIGEVFKGDPKAAIPAASPSALRPLAEIAVNRNFMGNAISPEGWGPNDTKPDSERAWTKTPEFWKALARAANAVTGGDEFEAGGISVSPETLEHLWTSYTGGAGRFVTGAAIDPAANIIAGKAPFETPARVPILRRLIADAYPGYTTSRFYEIARELEPKRKVLASETVSMQRQDEIDAKWGEAIEAVGDSQSELRKLRKDLMDAQTEDEKAEIEAYMAEEMNYAISVYNRVRNGESQASR